MFCVFGLKAQKHSAQGDADTLSRDNNTILYIVYWLPCKDKSVLVCHLRRKVIIVLHSAILIKFPKANYLTFECLLSRNVGDFSGSVMVWVDFFEYLSIKQFIVFQVFAK